MSNFNDRRTLKSNDGKISFYNLNFIISIIYNIIMNWNDWKGNR